MKFVKIFVTFSSILLLNSSFSTTIIPESPSDDQKLAKSVCKITNDVTRAKTDTQDILIGNFGGQAESTVVNDII
jgi:hypothetical protein